MSLIADRLHRAGLDLHLRDFAWVLLAGLTAAIVAGAVASVLAGYPASGVIGADGMAGTFLMAP